MSRFANFSVALPGMSPSRSTLPSSVKLAFGNFERAVSVNLPSRRDRIGNQVSDLVAIEHQAGDLDVSVHHRMLQRARTFHREVSDARRLQSRPLDLRNVGQIDALPRQVDLPFLGAEVIRCRCQPTVPCAACR